MTDQNRWPLKIQVLNRQRRVGIRREPVALFCAAVLDVFEKAGSELSVVFVSPREMRTLNRRYLSHDYATDVLSFAYEEPPAEGPAFLGEILIAPEVAARQAAQYRVPPEKELRKLLVHGILHLLGYNHETDRGEMLRLQARLLRRRSLAHSPSLMRAKETR